MKRMNEKQINTIILLTITLLTSCLSDTVKPDILLNYTPKITVNTDFDNIWVAGMPVSLEITTSEGSIDSELPKLLKDATVEYVANDGSKGSLLYNAASEHYVTSKSFIPGTAVQLNIKHPSYPSVGSLIRFPETIDTNFSLSTYFETVDGKIQFDIVSKDSGLEAKIVDTMDEAEEYLDSLF